MNDFDITAIETLVTDEIRKLSVSSNVWNNRPKSTSDTINDFVVVKVSGGVTDKSAFGECVISVRLFARDVKEMKNKKRLSVMQKAAEDVGPVGDGDLDQLRLDRSGFARHESGETPAGVVNRARDRAGLNADGAPAEAVVVFSGHQGPVGDDLYGAHLFAFPFLANPFLT